MNLLSGNIRFKGDLDVLGNVEEGMVVEADGNILIQKMYMELQFHRKMPLSFMEALLKAQSQQENKIFIHPSSFDY